jgi:hypothetical protein
VIKTFLKTHGFFIGLLALIILVALPILTYPMGRDQGMYANIGRVILAGGTPYVDMWDIKPPPIYYLYALSIGLFGLTTQAIRALDLMLVPLGLLGLYLLGTRILNKRFGLMAMLLFGVFYFNDGFQNLSQSDSLATIPNIWAAYFAIRAGQAALMSRQALIFAFITGVLLGLLVWFKPQYLFIVAAFVLAHLYQRIRNQNDGVRFAPLLKTIFIEGLNVTLGLLLVAGGLLAYFAYQGVLQEMLIVGQGTSAYNAQGYDFAAFLNNMGNGFYYRWTVWHGLILLSGLWFALEVTKRFFRTKADSKDAVPTETPFILLWLAAGFAFAFIQAKGFDTHWFPLLPPMALLGASALMQVIEALSKSIKKKLIAFYAISVIVLLSIPVFTSWVGVRLYLTGQENLQQYWDRFQANDLKPEQSLQVAEFLRERVVAGDSLFIWGFRPEVYYMAGLWPASRYQAQFPLVAPWYPEEWKQNNVDILWAAMPPYVLVLEDDYMAWVTNSEADSHTLLQSYTELNNWLIANYERETQIGDFLIWKRKS